MTWRSAPSSRFLLLTLIFPDISCSYSPSCSPTRTRTHPCLAEERKRSGLPRLLLRGKGDGESRGAPLLVFCLLIAPLVPLVLLLPFLLPPLLLDGRSGWGGSHGGWRRPGGQRPWRTAASAVGGGSGRRPWRMRRRLPPEMCDSRRRAMAAAD